MKPNSNPCFKTILKPIPNPNPNLLTLKKVNKIIDVAHNAVLGVCSGNEMGNDSLSLFTVHRLAFLSNELKYLIFVSRRLWFVPTRHCHAGRIYRECLLTYLSYECQYQFHLIFGCFHYTMIKRSSKAISSHQ